MEIDGQKKKRTSRVLKRGLALGVGFSTFLLMFVIFPAFVLAPTPPAWVPEPIALWGFDMRLLIGRPLTNLSSLSKAVQGEMVITLAQPAQQITIQNDGLTLVGDLYGANEGGNKPAILLLHGSTPKGRKLGLYRLIGRSFAEMGYVVLVIDLRGYGQSDDPPVVEDVSSFDFVSDVASALAYLEGLPEVNAKSIFLVGHSAGGDVAITAVATQAVSVDKLVLIGPSRRVMERGGTLDAPEFDYFRRREMRFMKLSSPIPAQVYQAYRESLLLEQHLDYLSHPLHTPLLLLDSELESKDDQLFLQDIFSQITGSKKYVTLTNADHYVNVASLGSLIIYDDIVLNQFIEELERFFQLDNPNLDRPESMRFQNPAQYIVAESLDYGTNKCWKPKAILLSAVGLAIEGAAGSALLGMRESRGNSGYLAQDDPVSHFGLGEARPLMSSFIIWMVQW
jgi:pimeloyl-ACP methyl ester carboxylesterase